MDNTADPATSENTDHLVQLTQSNEERSSQDRRQEELLRSAIGWIRRRPDAPAIFPGQGPNHSAEVDRVRREQLRLLNENGRRLCEEYHAENYWEERIQHIRQQVLVWEARQRKQQMLQQSVVEQVNHRELAYNIANQDLDIRMHQQRRIDNRMRQQEVMAGQIHHQELAERINHQDVADQIFQQDMAIQMHQQRGLEVQMRQQENLADQINHQDLAERINHQDAADQMAQEDPEQQMQQQAVAPQFHVRTAAEIIAQHELLGQIAQQTVDGHGFWHEIAGQKHQRELMVRLVERDRHQATEEYFGRLAMGCSGDQKAYLSSPSSASNSPDTMSSASSYSSSFMESMEDSRGSSPSVEGRDNSPINSPAVESRDNSRPSSPDLDRSRSSSPPNIPRVRSYFCFDYNDPMPVQFCGCNNDGSNSNSGSSSSSHNANLVDTISNATLECDDNLYTFENENGDSIERYDESLFWKDN